MKISLKSGFLQVMHSGEIQLYHSDDYSDFIELGRCTDGGFESSAWGEWEESEIDELRQSLIELYFGERETHDPIPQREWPDEVLSFLRLEELPVQPKLEALVTLDEKELESKKRYINEDGVPCQGLYLEKESGDLLLLKRGQLIEKRRPKEFDKELFSEGILSAESLGPWLDENAEFINLEDLRWKRMEEGKSGLGQFHFGLESDLHKRGLELDEKNWHSLVFPHKEKEGHFRLICWTKEKLSELISDENKLKWQKAHPDVDLDWEQNVGLFIQEMNEGAPQAFLNLMALLEGVPSDWVFADHID